MTQANVKSGGPEAEVLALDDPSPNVPRSSDAATSPTGSLLSMAQVRAAANDDAAASQNAIGNPLWIVAIGMACLFGTMASVIALS